MRYGSFSGLIRQFGVCPILSFAPDAGGGTGGGVGSATIVDDPDLENPPEPVVDEKKYTDKDVERMALQRVKRLTKDTAAKDKKITDLEDEIKKLSEQITEKLNTPPSDPAISTIDSDNAAADLKRQQGHWDVQRTRFESTIKDLQTKLQTAEKELTKVSQERSDMERDLEIDKALSSPTVQCIDVDNARILVRGKVEYDAENEEWIYKTRNGNILPVKEGIEAELPDYLRPSNLRQGGSGTTSGSPKTAAKRRELESLKAELETTKSAARKAPYDTALVVKAGRLRKKIDELEKLL